MRRVAIFTGLDIRTFGGGETYAINLANELIRSGKFSVDIFSPIGKKETFRRSLIKIKKLTKAGIHFFRAPEVPVALERFALTGSGLRMISRMKHYDVIYNEDPSLVTNFLLLIASKLYKNKLIFALHNPSYLRSAPLKDSAIRRGGLSVYGFFRNPVLMSLPNIHTINSHDKEALIKMGYSNKIYEIPIWSTVNAARRVKPAKEFTALFVGRLQVNQKGVDLLCRIIESTIRRDHLIKFHVVGSGDDGKRMVNQIAGRHRKNVTVLGFVDDKKLEQEYLDASLYVLTSRFEGHPATLVNAQGYGLPAVAFSVRGVTDTMKSKEQGSLVKPFDVEKFSGQIVAYRNAWKKGAVKYNSRKARIARIIKMRYGRDVIIPRMIKMLDE